MQKTHVVIPKNCTGCRTCELACSMTKGNAGALGHSRINIRPAGGEKYIQLTCLQCVEAACVKVCPTQALLRDAETGAIEVKGSHCIGCSLCEAACPFGHIHFDRTAGVPLKCDLCGGTPACVAACHYGALVFKQPDTDSRKLRAVQMKQRIDSGSPEEKRHRLAVNILNGTVRIPRTAGYMG